MDRSIVITRTFNAPRELVWKVWTDAEYLAQWWGPHGWSLSLNEMDFRPGGTWLYCMEGPDDMQSCGRSEYQEIVEPERIVYTDYFADSDGNISQQMPAARVSVEFTEVGGRTQVVTTSEYPTTADRDRVLEMGMEAGTKETLDRAEALLASLV